MYFWFLRYLNFTLIALHFPPYKAQSAPHTANKMLYLVLASTASRPLLTPH